MHHPGRGKPRELPLSPEDVLWHRFVDGYTRPFHEKYGDNAADGAGYMLDLIEEGAFVETRAAACSRSARQRCSASSRHRSIPRMRSRPVTLKPRSPSCTARPYHENFPRHSWCSGGGNLKIMVGEELTVDYRTYGAAKR